MRLRIIIAEALTGSRHLPSEAWWDGQEAHLAQMVSKIKAI